MFDMLTWQLHHQQCVVSFGSYLIIQYNTYVNTVYDFNNKCVFLLGLEAQLQQVNVSEPWIIRGSCSFGPSLFGSQLDRLHRTVHFRGFDLPKTAAAGGEPSERDSPSYLHYSVSSGKLLDLWAQVRNTTSIAILYSICHHWTCV